MAKAGDIIVNPVTGERIVFLQTAKETGGELVQGDLVVKPGGFVAAEHVHPHQEERFTVHSGILRLRSRGEDRDLRGGEEATVPAGTPHVWWNAGEDELRVRVELRPAGRFEGFVTSFFALAQAGNTDAKGMPNLLQLAVIAREYRDVIYPTKPPRPLQTVLFGILAPVGRMLGYRADVPYVEAKDRVTGDQQDV
jgi:quercetin dioxygenase-like cupin family protein